MSEPALRKLILGSTSPYRRELLARLHLPFEIAAPAVDETALAFETPRQLACRLAMAKAQAVAVQFPACVVIGADQVAELNGLSLIHISEPTRQAEISYAVFCLKKKNKM